MPETTLTGRKLSSMSGWDIAKHFGCHYSGDSSPIPHGGFFYSTRDWLEYGYAEVVEFYMIDDDLHETVYVSKGIISGLDKGRLREAFRYLGLDPEDPNVQNSIHMQVEAIRAYRGMDEEDTRRFPLATWKEERIWGAVTPWLEELRG